MLPLDEAFEANVIRSRGCWGWKGSTHVAGYAMISRGHGPSAMRAHRFSYEKVYGKIPDGLTIDHMCRNRICTNPKHLRAVTHTVNILAGESPTAKNARKKRCIHGHSKWKVVPRYDGSGRMRRICEVCTENVLIRYRNRHREELNARARTHARKARLRALSPRTVA